MRFQLQDGNGTQAHGKLFGDGHNDFEQRGGEERRGNGGFVAGKWQYELKEEQTKRELPISN